MQAAPARYVSTSELYSTDEVELLLDEIRELEPTSCRGEDVQDFEIAGSGCEVEEAGGGGGRSPAGTEVSWDSHAQYRAGGAAPPRALAPLYVARSLRGLLAALGALLAAAAAACAFAAGRRAARPLLLAALTSAPLHSALALLHISRLYRIMPLPWNHIGAGCAAWTIASTATGSALLLRHVLTHRLRPLTADLYFAAIGLACHGAALAAAYLWLCAAAWRRRGGARGAYRAVPAAAPPAPPPPPPAPSTSRPAPL